MLLHTATEEISHIEMLSHAVALNLEKAPAKLQEEGVKDAVVGAVMGGGSARHQIEGMIHKQLLSSGMSAMPVDSDGVPYRTLPGTHPTRGAYFTRGTTKDAYARYSETGPDYVYNVERLLRKFATAATLVPQPVLHAARRKTRLGVIYFGSTSPAMHEALEVLTGQGIHLDALRLRAFPFPASVGTFIAEHEEVFVVEQNRDAQMRSLLVNELDVDPARLVRVLHFDGTPITARFIVGEIERRAAHATVVPMEKGRAAS